MDAIPARKMSLAEIEAHYPDHWILIDHMELDAGKRLVGGVVVFVGQEKRQIYQKIHELKLHGFAIHRTKKEPPGRKYL
jgi:hypothetical protein